MRVSRRHRAVCNTSGALWAKEQLERQLQEHREREAGDKPLDFMGFYTF